MRNRWFHRPVFHTELDEEKAVTWLELFYDLVFVAAIIQMGNVLSTQVTEQHAVLGPMMQFAALFIPLWVAWTGFTFFANRFGVDDFFHRMLVFVKMIAMGVMAIVAADVAFENDHRAFSLAYAVVQAIVAAMYLRAWRQVPEARTYSAYWGSVFGAGALLWFAAAWIATPWAYVLWAAGVLAVLVAPVSKQSRQLAERFPLDMEHLGERYGLLTIIVLGESFVKVLTYLASAETGFGVPYLMKASASLFITCSIWWIYFDDVAGAHVKKGKGEWIVWFYGHLPLAVGITALGVAVNKVVGFDFSLPPESSYQAFLAGSLALVFFSVGIIDAVTERRDFKIREQIRVNIRFGSAILVLLVGQVFGAMSAGLFIAIITAICVGQIIFDMMVAPVTGTDRIFEEATRTGDRARQVRVGSAKDQRERRRWNPAEVLRRGTPSELKRDMFFYLMEGSWTRLLVILGFLFVVFNGFFAGLYLLDPNAILGNDPTFANAFAFSVQTMATIGYGVMSPGTPYADAIVAVEAAFGILLGAIATGLMFARASRPQSNVVFSNVMVLSQRNGRPTLMFRVGNARGNEVVEATIHVSVLREEISPEGHHLRKMHDLELVRSRSTFFSLTWLVMHEITEDSPLADIDFEQGSKDLIFFAVTLQGHDVTYGQTTYARQVYMPEDICPRHRFVDVLSETDDGQMLIDFTEFDSVELDEGLND